MSTTSMTDSTPVGNPNADVIAGLREIADWLQAHPELPQAAYAIVSLRSDYQRDDDARAVLTAVAKALGERAKETSGHVVTIRGEFNAASVIATAKTRDLIGLPPEPMDYPPIIPAQGSKE